MFLFVKNVSRHDIIRNLNLCDTYLPMQLAEEVAQVVRIAFANINMANYPPPCPKNRNFDIMQSVCEPLLDDSLTEWERLAKFVDRQKLHVCAPKHHHKLKNINETLSVFFSEQKSCFDLLGFVPKGKNGSIRCGDMRYAHEKIKQNETQRDHIAI